MQPHEAKAKRHQSLSVVMVVMSMEPHGGVADQMTTLALELPKYGVQPVVLVRNPLSPKHGYAAMLRQAGIKVEAIRHERYRQVRGFCHILARLALPLAMADAALRRKTLIASQRTVWSILRRLGYAGLDLIFGLRLLRLRAVQSVRLVHFRKPDSWSWIARARRLGLVTIYTEDTIPWQHTVDYYIGLSAVANSITMVTAVSRASATALETYLPMHTPIRVIPNIVLAPDANHQSKSIKKGDFVVGSLARLDLEKDIETLLLAVRAAIQEQAQIRLLVFGDGPLRDRLETLAHSLKLNDHVEFRGAYTKNDLTKIMTEIDMVALSSHYEGFGVVLVEGMAFGKPVVATAVGGVVDVVEDGLSGFLVPARDPEALAEKILALSNDRQLYERMAHAARQRYLACFTPERVVPQYMALYKRMAA